MIQPLLDAAALMNTYGFGVSFNPFDAPPITLLLKATGVEAEDFVHGIIKVLDWNIDEPDVRMQYIGFWCDDIYRHTEDNFRANERFLKLFAEYRIEWIRANKPPNVLPFDAMGANEGYVHHLGQGVYVLHVLVDEGEDKYLVLRTFPGVSGVSPDIPPM